MSEEQPRYKACLGAMYERVEGEWKQLYDWDAVERLNDYDKEQKARDIEAVKLFLQSARLTRELRKRL